MDNGWHIAQIKGAPKKSSLRISRMEQEIAECPPAADGGLNGAGMGENCSTSIGPIA
jgi:hypothetical protein